MKEFEAEFSHTGEGLTDNALCNFDWSLAEGCVALNLHDNSIASLESLAACPLRLLELNLSSNKLTSCRLPDNISKLTSLTSLDLSANMISDLRAVPFMPSLTVFSVAFNRIHNVLGIDAFPNLKELHIQGNRIASSAALDELSQLQHLTALSISTAKGGNPVCREFHSLYRIFGECLSLKVMDGKPRAVWDEQKQEEDRRQRSAHFVVSSRPVPPTPADLMPSTSRLDSVSAWFRRNKLSQPPQPVPMTVRYHSPSRSAVLFPPASAHPPSSTFAVTASSVRYDAEHTVLAEEEEEEEEDDGDDAVEKLGKLVTVLQHWRTLTAFKHMAKALHRMHVHVFAVTHVKRCNEMAAEHEKRLLQENQKHASLQKKHIANEILISELRKQIAVLERNAKEQQDALRPPAEPSGPSPELLEAQAALRALQAHVDEQVLNHKSTELSVQAKLTKLTSEVEGMAVALASKSSALQAAEDALHNAKQQLVLQDEMISSLQLNASALQQALSCKDKLVHDKEREVRELTARHQTIEADLKNSALLNNRAIQYEQEALRTKQQLDEANQKLASCSNLNGKLEERLAHLVNEHAHQVNQMRSDFDQVLGDWKAENAKCHETLKALSKYVREMEHKYNARKEECAKMQQDMATQSQIAIRLEEELRNNQEQLDEQNRQLEQYRSNDKTYQESMRKHCQQLSSLEQAFQENEKHRAELESQLKVKEVIVQDQLLQLQSLAELKRKCQALEKDNHALSAAKKNADDELFYQLQELSKLQQDAERADDLEQQLQYAYDKLQKQKADHDTAYTLKVDECRRFGEALAFLEAQVHERDSAFEQDKRRLENEVVQGRNEKKGLSKLIKALEAELTAKEHELLGLREAKQAFDALQEACMKFNQQLKLK